MRWGQSRKSELEVVRYCDTISSGNICGVLPRVDGFEELDQNRHVTLAGPFFFDGPPGYFTEYATPQSKSGALATSHVPSAPWTFALTR